MEKVKFSITLDSDYQTVPPTAEVHVAGREIFKGQVTGPTLIVQHLELEDNSDYQLLIKLVDKHSDHTVVDDQGNVIKDSSLKIKKLVVEDIEIQSVLSTNPEKFYYEHSGSQHILYDTLGVNGQAVINFSTPFYIWLLETI